MKKSSSDFELTLRQHEFFLRGFYEATHHVRDPYACYGMRQEHVQILKQLYGASISITYFKHKFLDMNVLESCDLPCHFMHLK